MSDKIVRNYQTINAANQTIGRLASQSAKFLMGKHKTSYLPYIDGGDFVKVENIKNVKFSGKKTEQKVFYRHSGYPGGIKTRNLSDMAKLAPEKVLVKAVRNMLPANKLRNARMKRLIIK